MTRSSCDVADDVIADDVMAALAAAAAPAAPESVEWRELGADREEARADQKKQQTRRDGGVSDLDLCSTPRTLLEQHLSETAAASTDANTTLGIGIDADMRQRMLGVVLWNAIGACIGCFVTIHSSLGDSAGDKQVCIYSIVHMETIHQYIFIWIVYIACCILVYLYCILGLQMGGIFKMLLYLDAVMNYGAGGATFFLFASSPILALSWSTSLKRCWDAYGQRRCAAFCPRWHAHKPAGTDALVRSNSGAIEMQVLPLPPAADLLAQLQHQD
jgi:hypothetical protein